MVDETEEEVSPERAAEILGILRSLVYQRMDAGKLPYRLVGSDRTIRVDDIVTLKRLEDQRRSFAAALSADTEDLEENYAHPVKPPLAFRTDKALSVRTVQMTQHRRETRKTVLGTVGSGNVFADLGLPDAETLLLKAKLVSKIDEVIKKRGLTQAEAAKIMGLSEQELSALRSGQTEDYSLERLRGLLSKTVN